MLETLFQKPLPHQSPIGESWEICDRPEAQTLVANGRFAGQPLNHLWSNHREEIFGKKHSRHPSPRFPLLIKLLDAREKLSVQVHPPAEIAPQLGGEPKTEVWVFLDTSPDAHIYAGLKPGITKEHFLALLESGKLEEALPKIPVKRGESIFIPSGRIHAIGEGNVIAEIQQNSDTTYRVFDWNRLGLDGKPRQLHIRESLLSINFHDFDPQVQNSESTLIADCPYFKVVRKKPPFVRPNFLEEEFAIWFVASGKLTLNSIPFLPGTFLLLPAKLDFHVSWESFQGQSPELLEITLPSSQTE